MLLKPLYFGDKMISLGIGSLGARPREEGAENRLQVLTCEFQMDHLMSQTLDELFEYLDRLDCRARLTELTGALAETELEWQQLSRYIQFSSRGYTRTLV